MTTQKMTASQKIVEVVNRSNTPLTTTQVASRSHVNTKTVRNLLPILGRQGFISYS